MKIFSCAFFLLLFFTTEDSCGRAQHFVLSPGDSKVLSADNKPIQVIGKHVISVTYLDTENLTVHIKKVGQATLFVGVKKYLFHSLSPQKISHYNLMKQKIKSFMGLKLGVAENHIVLTGELLRLSDLISLKSPDTKKNFQLKTQVSSEIKEKIKLYIAPHLKHLDFKWIWSPQVCLAVPSSYKFNLSQIKKTLNSYGICLLKNLPKLNTEKMVRIQTYWTEIENSDSQGLGLTLPNSLNFNILEKSFSEITLKLKALEKAGNSRILASPTLLVQSGKEARFLAGGEYPIHSYGPNHSTTKWKPYGISMSAKPKVDLKGSIGISLILEISAPDTSYSTEKGVPGFKSSRIQSHLTLKHGKKISFLKLNRDGIGHSYASWPSLRNIPLLGSLFSSDDFSDKKTSLYVFISAKVVAP